MSRRPYARDIRGADAADLDGSTRSTAVAVAAPSPTAATHQPHVALMLGLQRTAGNQAVLGLLGMRSARHSLASTRAVQRQDDEYEDAGSGWGTNEESSSSDYSSGESSGAGSEWSSGGDGGAGGGGGEGAGGGSWTGGESPASESPGGDYGGGSEWSGGGAVGGESAGYERSSEGGAGGEGEGGGGAGAGAGGGESAGSEWSGGGGAEGGAGGESAGSEWSGGGGSEEQPAGDEGGSSWWPFGGDEESGDGEGGEEGDFSTEEMQAKLDEGEIAPVEDETVSIRSSPIYTPPGGQGPAPSGFHDDGRSGTVPFGSLDVDDLRGEDAHVPHAITTGGRTGTVAWSGGGKAGGPRGHPGTGIPSTMVEPKYDTAWNGPFAYASAWVIPGTGVFDIHRTYESSNAGDQGNGWWISARAAAALEAHEVRHIEAAKSAYGSRIQPLLDRIAKSKSVGYHTNYLASHAIAVLQQYIKWKASIDKFVEEDAQWNADGGQIDTEDYVSPSYPHYHNGPKTIQGKSYDKYLVMNDEEPPP